MKQIHAFVLSVLLLAILFLASPGMAHAAAVTSGQQAQAVQSLEDTLFATHYDRENLDARVGRLEAIVFGQSQTGPLDARISKLKSVLSPSALGPLSPVAKAAPVGNNPAATAAAQAGNNTAAPKGMTPNQPMANANPSTTTAQASPTQKVSPAPGETDYPTVSQMELKRFGKTYVQDDLTVRLTRLEKDVFKTVQTGQLADRADNLRLVVLGDAGSAAPSSAPSSAMAYPDPSAGGGYYPPSAPSSYGAGSSYGSPAGYSSYGSGYGSNYGSGASSYPQPPNYGASSYSGTPIASGYGGGYSNTLPSSGYNTAMPNNAYGNAPVNSGGTGMNADPTPDQVAALNEVEKEVLGHSYPSEPFGARLDRVENKVFHTTSPEMSNEDRIQRVIAVASAGGAPLTGKAKAKATFQTLLPIILTILPMVLL